MAIDDRLLNNPEDLLSALTEGKVDLTVLDDGEIEILSGIMAELEETGDSATLSMLYEADFWRPPPTIQEFLEDDFFLGSVCRKIEEENQNGLYACWKEVLSEAFSPVSKVQQLILSGCLSHDTLVTMADGLMIPLGELLNKRNLAVQTSDGPRLSDGAADSGVKRVFRVILANGMEIKATPDHEVECCGPEGREWKRVDQLTGDDHVVVPRGVPYCQKETLTDAEVKLLAYWPTDGNLCTSNSCASFTDGNLETCEEVLASLASMGWSGSIEPESRGQKCWVVTVKKTATSGFRDWLLKHRAHLKTEDVLVPSAIHTSPLRHIALFLNRVWAAEGTVYNRVRTSKGYTTTDGFLQLRMKSERFIREVQHLLLRFGITSSVNKIRLAKKGKRPKDYGHHWNVCINGHTDIRKFFEQIGPILGKEEASEQLLASLDHRRPRGQSDSIPVTGKWLGDYMTANGIKKYGTKWVGLIQGQRRKKLTRRTFDEWLDHHAGIPAAEALRHRFRSSDWLVPVESVEDAGEVATGDIVNSANKKWIANGISVHNCIGGGKSFCGSVAMLYKMARVLCMRNPLLYFGMSSISKLTFTFLGPDRTQVKEGAFSYALNGMLMSPFFNEQTLITGDRKYSGLHIDLMRNVTLEAGSKARHALGRNVLGALVDEISFRIEKEAAKEAEKLVKGLERRYKSRFRQSTEGLLVIISSANQETDFLVSHMKKMRNSPTAMVCDFPYWRTAGPIKFAGTGGYLFEREPDNPAAWFAVDTGSNTDQPAVIYDDEVLERIRNESPSRIMMVPIEHKVEFEEDTMMAIRDIGGRSTGRMTKYFSNILPLINSIRDYEPVAKGFEVNLSIDAENGLDDFFYKDRLLREDSGRFFPKRDPRSPRFIHMDMSTGAIDAMGMAMVHPVHFRKVLKTDTATQLISLMAMPVFEIDFAIRLVRGKSREPLDFGRIRQFIVWLRSCGFNIAGVSCDLRSLSFETRNILKRLGFEATYFSLDINKVGYDTLKQVVSEKRLLTHPHDFLFLELINLEDTGKKVDHPRKFDIPWGDGSLLGSHEFGSKDLADSVAGAIFHAENAKTSFDIPYEEDILRAMVGALETNTGKIVHDAPKNMTRADVSVF